MLWTDVGNLSTKTHQTYGPDVQYESVLDAMIKTYTDIRLPYLWRCASWKELWLWQLFKTSVLRYVECMSVPSTMGRIPPVSPLESAPDS